MSKISDRQHFAEKEAPNADDVNESFSGDMFLLLARPRANQEYTKGTL